MRFKAYIIHLFLRFLAIQLALITLGYGYYKSNSLILLISAIAIIVLIAELVKYAKRRFRMMDDFFEAVKYKDFSRWYPEDRGAKDIRFLHKGFNEVNRTIKEVNAKSEAQYLYLQKIMEMVDVGIVAYNLDTGDVLWSNETFSEFLDLPGFKNIGFVEKRKPEIFASVFETYYRMPESISITVKQEKLKVLISETIFEIENSSFKLIVLQNIDNTLNQNETEAWKKLLSVMTHEIMNSIAPISSLADTLDNQLSNNQDDPEEYPVILEDISHGIQTIKSRSEGLLKFARTYRSLRKPTELNLEKIKISDLFEGIKTLMKPSLQSKGIEIRFEQQTDSMELEIDKHLIEQVLINLIVNAKDALKNQTDPTIRVKAEYGNDQKISIKVYDNGEGIPDDLLEKVFVPFFTSKNTGSGIGLSLCKQIMLQHKGKIQVKSKENEGTLFILVF